jgi:hypothetical protein
MVLTATALRNVLSGCLSTAPRKFVSSWVGRRPPGKARRGRMATHVTEEQRSPAAWIRYQMGTKLRAAVFSSTLSLAAAGRRQGWAESRTEGRRVLHIAHTVQSPQIWVWD